MRRIAVAALVATTAVAGPAQAHETRPASALPGAALAILGASAGAAPAGASRAVIDGAGESAFVAGPCTGPTAAAMPDGGGHDHLDPAQHRLACRMEQVAHLPLVTELAARPGVILGEMDIKAGIAAVLVSYPEAGALFFDVRDPANPRFLSWLRAGECEGAVIDVDCGAFIDLSADAKTAFLSTQNISALPGSAPPPGTVPNTVPGVYAIDLADPTAPRISDAYPVANVGGIHTARSHVIPGKGEFLFTNTLSGYAGAQASIDVLRVERVGGLPRMTLVARIEVDELHDTFIQDDPLDGRTYLYVAGGFETGFLVFDVSDPAAARLAGEWDLTPQCANDWYSHTLDVAVRNGRRYVTLPAELFTVNGSQSTQDTAKGCGKVAGNGDAVGPLWIVDATDLKRLGPALAKGADDAQKLAASSRATLVATWTNPAGRAAGNLTFSPHNQDIDGDVIYLSHYHGGVLALDASAAFAGRRERPREIGLYVAHDTRTRPIYAPLVTPLLPFYSTFPPTRPEIWDAHVDRGHVYASDMRGGLSVMRLLPDAPAPMGNAVEVPALSAAVAALRVGARVACNRRSLSVRVRGKDAARVRRIEVTTSSGRRLAVVTKRRAKLEARIARRSLRGARALRIVVVLDDRRTAVLRARVPACRGR